MPQQQALLLDSSNSRLLTVLDALLKLDLPSLFAKLITIGFKKKILRHIFGYLALFCLLIFVELKTGFLVGRPCSRGVFVNVYPDNSSNPEDQTIPYHIRQQQYDDFSQPTAPPKHTRFKMLPKGSPVNIMGNPDIFIPTAVRILDFPQQDDFTLLLHAWARNISNTKFSCCLLKTLDDEIDEIVSVKAFPHKRNPDLSHLDSGDSIDLTSKIGSSEFYCSLSKSAISAINHIADFKYVTFSSDNSCSNSQNLTRDVLKIENEENVFRSVGLCVSLPRTFVNAEYLVEWLEWYRLHGVTEIYFYFDHDLHKAIKRIFQYYELVGYVRTFRWKQPIYYYKDGVPVFDEEMVSNDCRHRMSHFDYVITLDVSELIAPMEFNVDIYDILKNASVLYPPAGVFQIHSYQVILDWKPSKNSPLHLARHELRSDVINEGDDVTLSRWAYIPHRTQAVSKNKAWPKKSFTSNPVPKSSYSLLRLVRCHPRLVKGCTESNSTVKEKAVSKFQNALITAMRETPIDYVLQYNKRYLDMFNKIRIPGDSYFIGKG